MQKNRNLKRKTSNILLFLIVTSLINCCNDEEKNPEIENYFITEKIMDSLYVEHYDDGFSTEVYLTDSLTYRLYILRYVFEYSEGYNYKINDKRIVFYNIYSSVPTSKIKYAKSYTFEELKKKNNLKFKK